MKIVINTTAHNNVRTVKMNWRWINFTLSFIIFVKLNSNQASGFKFKKVDFLSDDESRDNKYTRRPSRYYKYLSMPFSRNRFAKFFKSFTYDKPFTDLTRDDVERALNRDDNQFSTDYIDITDLARFLDPVYTKSTYEIEPKQNGRLLVDIEGNPREVLNILQKIARRRLQNQENSNSDKSDTESSSSDDESSADKTKKTPTKPTRYGPKRFEVINNNSAERSGTDNDVINVSVETSDFEDDTRSQFKQTNEDSEENYYDEYIYMQSPTRQLKSHDGRRRLKTFLPKRVHWDENDFLELRNYWINGPRGRYPAQYKTPY